MTMTTATTTKKRRWSRLIATEEAFAFPEYLDVMRGISRSMWRDLDLDTFRFFLSEDAYEMEILSDLVDVDARRLAVMDMADIDVAILSLVSPGVQLFDPETATSLAAHANDFLAQTIKRHPRRFAGLASFAPQDPERAALEIERAVRKLGLNGVLVNSHTGGEYLDDPKYGPIFEAATALDVPLYLHPRNPPPELRGSITTSSGFKMSEVMWGFHMETALHAMRLIAGGVFDRFPSLKVVLGHLGEGLPSLLWRIDWFAAERLKRRPSDVFRENFYVTMSGMFEHELCHPTLSYCRELYGGSVDHILFAADHPFAIAKDATQSLHTAPFSDHEVEKIACRNAEKLFRLNGAAS